MKEYEIEQIARPTNQIARGIAISLFLVAAATVLTTFRMESYALFGQLAAVFLLTAAVLITTRYVVKGFTYRTEQKQDGSYDFVIVDVQGKRRTVAVRLSFSSQIDGFLTDADAIRAAKRDKNVRTYSYCLDIAPARACAVTAHDGEDRILVVFVPDDDLRSAITTLAAGTTD